MFNTKDGRSFYNAIASVVLVAWACRIVRYFLDLNLFAEDMRLIGATFRGVQYMVLIYAAIVVSSFVVFALARLRQSCKTSIGRKLCDFAFFAYYATMHVVEFVAHRPFDLSLPMTYAYLNLFTFKYWKILHIYMTYDRDTENERKRTLTFQHYLQVMLLPVLLFKWEYPRSERSWLRVLWLFTEAMVIYVTVTFLGTSFWWTYMANYGKVPLSASWLIEAWVYAYALSVVMTFSVHYATMHSLLGSWSELARFADRR